jgi:hypothetical protein
MQRAERASVVDNTSLVMLLRDVARLERGRPVWRAPDWPAWFAALGLERSPGLGPSRRP